MGFWRSSLPRICFSPLPQYLRNNDEAGETLTLRRAADLSHEALGIIHLARQRHQDWWQSSENSNACHCSQGCHRGSALLPALPELTTSSGCSRASQQTTLINLEASGAKLLNTSLC